ncbi:MAG: hypothetical protein VXY90_14125, partial [Pseudomonadota bacterium]|nr:hypothetical protein [Pseudomonadota bacterium]
MGSESSSGAGAGGVWESGNLGIWESGNLGTWKSGNLEIWEPGNLGTWKSGNLGSKKSKKIKIKILKIKIRSAQNVGKVWISKKNPPGPISCHFRHFLRGTEKSEKKMTRFHIFLLFNCFGALAAIHLWWGCMLCQGM